jgi:hypothetical protein
MEEIDGPALMAAIRASGDVVWQAGDATCGVVLTIGLDRHSPGVVRMRGSRSLKALRC